MCPADGSIIPGWIRWPGRLNASPRMEGQEARAATHLLGDLGPTLGP